MFKSKYSTVLTIFLIILIIAIIVIVVILVAGEYKDYREEQDRKKVYATMKENANTIDNENTENNTNENLLIQPVEDNIVSNNTSQETTTRPTTKFYKDYPVVGYIKIEKTNIEYPILTDISPGALETSVGVMYPSNPKLNQPGNTVIIGHNYRNGKFFSDNKKLVIGDKIQITDLTGKTLTYKIYEISTIPETDTEYITRNRGDNIEISLSTCTDDGKARLVILAKAE